MCDDYLKNDGKELDTVSFYYSNWDNDKYNEFLDYIKYISDEKYKEFHKSLVPNICFFYGVRLPLMRNIAKQIVKGNYKEFLKIAKDDSYEEIMIQGLVIGNIKDNFDNIFKYIKAFVPKINNWAICDSFCSSLKIINKNKDSMYGYIKECLTSSEEFTVRFAVVILMDYYIDEKYLYELFSMIKKIKNDKYYVKMAIAWCISFIYIKFPSQTYKYLEDNKKCFDKFTYNKAIQKITESYRVTKENKNMLTILKIK